MILLDTTVLVYATGDAHPLRQPCRDLVGALRDGRLRASTTPEVLQEFAHVRARRRSRTDASALARDFGRLLRPLVTVDEDDLHEGLELFELHRALGAFDAVLAAAALRRSAHGLVSADRAFGAVESLPYVNPADPNLVARLDR